MPLTERNIQYGFNYYFKAEVDKIKSVVEVSEYNGEEQLIINCTQLDYWIEQHSKTEKDKKRILKEWCEFLTDNPTAFTDLAFETRMPQELFDAVCCQKNLRKLTIKWGAYKDISAIEKLEHIELVHIGSGAGVTSILPLSKLKKIIALSVENFQKITDYSPLSNLATLQSLSIEGDGLGPQYIKVTTLSFLHKMPQLRFFRLATARLQDKDYSPVTALQKLEYLTLDSNKEVCKNYDELVKLPHLKWGSLIEKPERYQK